MSVRRDWCPQPEMSGNVGRGKHDHADEDRRWIERHPVIKKEVGNTLLLRFTSDEQLVDLLAELVKRHRAQSGYGVSVTALAVLQKPRREQDKFETGCISVFNTWYVEGRALVCLG